VAVPKKAHRVGTPSSAARAAMFSAGSMPSTGNPRCWNARSTVPSLLAASNTRSLPLRPNRADSDEARNWACDRARSDVPVTYR
jgi:hypothetical protein